ncbi:MAG: SDR family oxidoreductase [Pseudomonadota bacterium]
MKTVLITGASSGIGHEFAKIFAHQGCNLVLVARSTEKLEKIANNYERDHDIKVTIFSFDLSQPNIANKLYSEIRNRKICIDILINNAGIGDYGSFVDGKLSKIGNMVSLNIATLTEMTLLFVKDMHTRNSGKVLNIASTAAFQPVPKFAVYAATKSYVLNFTEALHHELKGTGVSVSVLCPGPTATGFEKSANMKDSKLFKSGVMDAKIVAEAGCKGLMNNKMTIIPGFKNRLMAFLSSMTPSRNLLVWISGKIS